ncbi:MAG: NTP transferase domain-containing protein [Acidobacteriota bacterium]
MRFGAIVVGRLDSSRLPGKVLRSIHGEPLLAYVLARCGQIKVEGKKVVVATSSRSVDDPIADYCDQAGVACFRGPEIDVARRVLECATHFGFDCIARVNADSPFLEPALLEEACHLVRNEGYEFVTNLYPRSFPYGVSVEVMKTDTFEEACARMDSAFHREHVTRVLYEQIDRYRFFNITRREQDLSSVRLTIDTPEDLAHFDQFVRTRTEPWAKISYLQAVECYRKELLTT